MESLPSNHQFKNKPLRRKIGATLLGLTMLWNTDVNLDEVLNTMYGLESSHVALLNQYTNTSNDALVVTASGYGDFMYEDLARSVNTMIKSRNIAYVDYGGHLDIDSLERQIIDSIKKTHSQEVILYGVSFGGLVSLDLAARLLQEGIDVKKVYLDSSPSDLETVATDKKYYSQVIGNIPFGRTARFAGELGIKIWERHDGSLVDHIQYAAHKSRAIPNNLLKDQSAYLEQGLSSQTINTLNEHSVEVVYLRTRNPSDDQMVMVEASEDDFRREFRRFISLNDDIGHGGTTHHEDRVARLVSRTNPNND